MSPSENLKRILVSIAAIPVIVLASYFGGYYFLIFVLLISIAAYYEFVTFCKKKDINANLWLASVIVLVLIVNQFKHFIDVYTIIIISSLLLLISELFRNKGSAILNLGAAYLGIFYIGLFATSLLGLREFYPQINGLYERGGYLIISVLAGIWVGDSAAYYSGTALGKHKLFPRVSPNKSWEGAVFGFIFSIGTMILAKLIVLDFLAWNNVIIIGIIIGTVGQIGDLVESLLKRDAGIKDSSAIIPGHGGVFDRFDSLLFVAPAVWFYLRYFS
ncbi:MAG: phosphatidate cytidylyltransferase [Ignavibacteria bacterium]|nr:phosphatidate cytidylyltransferase [Ignavibacteria bacterium]MBT8381522.1 phosphatidate cytidylyltransferase [Ignavibacteria bacterium]MBT8391350.1 phosphatidate cytidylyltransferase [Ignavibacteria bacterium]NNJ53020.1 phosphatidate cytidylyltransferase [Ignavibacteriaceae bacterium]NNL21465.1 phosphatidate cytidylyltransferase [Ignavibacteriaceae bacterium]